jgi:hypothetical protein
VLSQPWNTTQGPSHQLTQPATPPAATIAGHARPTNPSGRA